MSEDERPESPLTVLTIGHSTRSIEEFIRLLKAHGATRVVDVRTVPWSRHNPQFNRDTLPVSLEAGFCQYGLEKPIVPGLCGLHADA